jgi:urease accessory protein
MPIRIFTITTVVTIMHAPVDATLALRLQAWLSPGFPTGAYAYSHGLERAVETGAVHDRASLVERLDADLRHGTGRNDAILFACAFRGAEAPGTREFLSVAELAQALRGTAELALESAAQGAAFLANVRLAWPKRRLELLAARLAAADIAPTLPVAVAACVAAHGIALEFALPLYLQSAVANQVSAGVRLIPLGQSDGQRAIAELEAAVADTGAAAIVAKLDDLGSAAVMVDIDSMNHETQYTRLFRS